MGLRCVLISPKTQIYHENEFAFYDTVTDQFYSIGDNYNYIFGSRQQVIDTYKDHADENNNIPNVPHINRLLDAMDGLLRAGMIKEKSEEED